MTTIRVNKQKDFVIMSNKHFKEKSMSLKAKGLLSQMLSLPDNWDYSIRGLASINKESEKSIKITLDELKKFKYLVVRKQMPNETKSGRIEYIYDVYEEPFEEKQPPQKQPLVFQPLENGMLDTNLYIYNKILNNKILNNKNIYSRVVDRMNELNGTKYSSTSKHTIELINGRLNEGYSEEDLLLVVEKMSYLWNQPENEKMKQYLRPSTLFRPTNFENYLNMPVDIKRTTKNIHVDLEDFINKGR